MNTGIAIESVDIGHVSTAFFKWDDYITCIVCYQTDTNLNIVCIDSNQDPCSRRRARSEDLTNTEASISIVPYKV